MSGRTIVYAGLAGLNEYNLGMRADTIRTYPKEVARYSWEVRLPLCTLVPGRPTTLN